MVDPFMINLRLEPLGRVNAWAACSFVI